MANINNRYEITSSTAYSPNVNDPQIWQNATRFLQTFSISILKSLAKTFCVTASKYSPPGNHGKKLGTANIDPKYYYRPIVDLLKAAKDPNIWLKKEDYQKIRQGYKFKVIYDKFREKRRTLGYAKSMRAAKRLARIQNRGLLKYSWGSIVNNFSGKVIKQSQTATEYSLDNKIGLYETTLPSSFRLLAQKSPNIQRYRWGDIRVNPIDMANGKWRVTLTNNAEYAGEIQPALRRASTAVYGQWQKMVNAINSGQIDTFSKYLKAELKRIEIKHK